MSFDKEYPNRKDHRKPYKGSKRFDTGCRNHGSCGPCKGNRLYQDTKERQRAKDLEKEGKDV
jgi:hypothetical protein